MTVTYSFVSVRAIVLSYVSLNCVCWVWVPNARVMWSLKALTLLSIYFTHVERSIIRHIHGEVRPECASLGL